MEIPETPGLPASAPQAATRKTRIVVILVFAGLLAFLLGISCVLYILREFGAEQSSSSLPSGTSTVTPSNGKTILATHPARLLRSAPKSVLGWVLIGLTSIVAVAALTFLVLVFLKWYSRTQVPEEPDPTPVVVEPAEAGLSNGAVIGIVLTLAVILIVGAIFTKWKFIAPQERADEFVLPKERKSVVDRAQQMQKDRRTKKELEELKMQYKNRISTLPLCIPSPIFPAELTYFIRNDRNALVEAKIALPFLEDDRTILNICRRLYEIMNKFGDAYKPSSPPILVPINEERLLLLDGAENLLPSSDISFMCIPLTDLPVELLGWLKKVLNQKITPTSCSTPDKAEERAIVL